jgi:MFS family permease
MLALMHPPALHAAGWLALSLAITYLGYSLASIGLQAWGAELGRDSRERTLLTASREGFGLLGVVAAAVLPALLAADAALGLSRLAWVFVGLLAALAGLTLLATPRPVLVLRAVPEATASPLAPLRDPSCSPCMSAAASPPRCRRRWCCSSSPTCCRRKPGAAPSSRCISSPVRRD